MPDAGIHRHTAHQAVRRTVTRRRAGRHDAVQAVVLIVLPRCEGKFGADGTGGIAAIRGAALDSWISCAFYNTATPTACFVPVSAIVVAS